MILRAAELEDAAAFADLLNEIIAIGGTTAMTAPVTERELVDRIKEPGAVWISAWDAVGGCLGFQWIAARDYLPKDVADIATFVRVGSVQGGVGSAMFVRTRMLAVEMGFREINATIRADNAGGLRYYARQGFIEVGRRTGVTLKNGLIVTQVDKRLRLD